MLVRWSVVGTHEGEIDGIEPTGNRVEYEEWAIYRIADGRIVELRALRDTLDLLTAPDAVDWPPKYKCGHVYFCHCIPIRRVSAPTRADRSIGTGNKM